MVCGGHSAGGAAAQISALYLKKMWPLANVASVNTASMVRAGANPLSLPRPPSTPT